MQTKLVKVADDLQILVINYEGKTYIMLKDLLNIINTTKERKRKTKVVVPVKHTKSFLVKQSCKWITRKNFIDLEGSFLIISQLINKGDTNGEKLVEMLSKL